MTYITQNIIKKILIVLIIIVTLCLFFVPTNKAYAATTYTQTLKSGIENFPEQYRAVLEQIKALHPNWTFEAYYTGVSWDTLIMNETGTHGRNRVINSSDLSWKCTCGNVASGYACASEGIVKYYLDPRNFLNEVNIFQFLEISYNEKIHNIDGVKSAVKGTFLDNNVTYTVIEKKEVPIEEIPASTQSEVQNENTEEQATADGTVVSENAQEQKVNELEATVQNETQQEVKTEIKDVEVEYTKHYAEIILEAAKQSNMSPYSIVTKIIQEVGTNGSSSVSGTYEGYTGYYNFYNLGAYDTGNAIVNGLRYARDKGWNNQYKAIIEGAKEIANSYTNAGQNTAYFYKWDVVGTEILESGKTQTISGSNMFWHQYMTNVQDPTSQSKSLYNTYARNNVLDKELNFIIPIYENMPTANSMPSGLTTEDGDLYYVNCTDGLAIREKPTTSATKLGTLYKNTVVAMIERECVEADGYKWDKVKLANGLNGYVASKYLTFKEASTKQEYKIEENESENIIVMTLGITIEKIENGTAIGEIKTGAKITVNGKEYTAVVLGDTNGDGAIKATDYMNLKNFITGKTVPTSEQKKASDVNGDGEVKATDYMKLKNYLTGKSKISL